MRKIKQISGMGMRKPVVSVVSALACRKVSPWFASRFGILLSHNNQDKLEGKMF
jgi:hypothetical protein